MFKSLFAGLCCSFVLFAGQAMAQLDISVDGVQRYFISGEKTFQTVKVSNNHQEKSFEIGARIQLYKNMYDSNRKEAELEDVEGYFLMAPKRFVLRPGESRSVRLVYTKPFDDNERIFRLSFKPKVIEANKVNDVNATAVKPAAHVVTAAGMLVLVSPKTIDNNLVYERDENGVTFKNEGNIAVDLRFDREYCYESGSKENCIELPGKRIYPGQTWRFEVEDHIPIRWSTLVYDKMRKWMDIPPSGV